MASLIFWFIVLIFIISSVVKGKKKPANRNRNAGTTQSCPVQKPRTQPTAAQTVKKQQTSYGSYKQSKAKPAASTTNIPIQKRQKLPNSAHSNSSRQSR